MLDEYANTMPGGSGYHLALWHGFGLPLLLSVVVLAVGTAGVLRPEPPAFAPGSPISPLGNADRMYDAVIRGLDVTSVRLTGETQRGSLPATQSVILSTLVVLPIVMLALGARDRPDFALWDSPLQVVVGLLMLAAAIGATVMRNRLAAVLLVGVTGYGCGAIFAFHGAPDLALTQFLVETLVLVIFVLVLRILPAEADATNINPPPAAAALPWRWRSGAAVTTLAVFAMAARNGVGIAELIPDAAYYRGHGANAVNVLLVDIRAWDTMGEVMVLLVAATGVASLVFRNRRFGSAPRQHGRAGQPDIGPIGALARPSATSPGCAAVSCATPRHRSLVLEVATRVIFPLIKWSSRRSSSPATTPRRLRRRVDRRAWPSVLRCLAGGRYELGETLPLDAGKIPGTGLGLSAGTAVASILLGAPALSSSRSASRRSGTRFGQDGDRIVLRTSGGVSHRCRFGARHLAQPRRPRGCGAGPMTTFRSR